MGNECICSNKSTVFKESNSQLVFNRREYIIQQKLLLKQEIQQEILFSLTKSLLIMSYESRASKYEKYTELNNQLYFQILYAKNSSAHPVGIRFNKYESIPIEFYTLSDRLSDLFISKLSKCVKQLHFNKCFRPVRKLGEGGFCSVYEAQRLSDKQLMAVKIFSKKQFLPSNISNEQRVQNQITILRKFESPYIVSLQYVFESKNSIYLVIELLEGGSLRERLKKDVNCFLIENIKKLMKGILKGLEVIHQKGIIHRDLKFENILLRSEDNFLPVIIDFGLAVEAKSAKDICGTPGFMAPQIYSQSNITSKCDVFSVGVIFHFLLTKHQFFKYSASAKAYKLAQRPNFSLKGQIYDKIDSQALDLLKKLLKQNPDERITASEALRHSFLCQGQIQYCKSEFNQTKHTDRSIFY